jgi:hypothetical protein
MEGAQRDRRRGHGEHDLRGDRRQVPRGVRGQETEQVHLQISQRRELPGSIQRLHTLKGAEENCWTRNRFRNCLLDPDSLLSLELFAESYPVR